MNTCYLAGCSRATFFLQTCSEAEYSELDATPSQTLRQRWIVASTPQESEDKGCGKKWQTSALTCEPDNSLACNQVSYPIFRCLRAIHHSYLGNHLRYLFLM
eukprot:6263199-Amphidinium_carterae.1